ncbi:MAG: methyltransferase domain-containing protein [Vicinamibacterales bacterium]|jgi:SAM-dependent methyltransferase|nr:methyltransferase domain-containing protein [Vicinamibacterales bacterium]MDP7480472.1 methyltransferase domain-containing protein [Vicinamibacterales bacterium]MDP7670677.1 methyltransferase domain-containing protein [Vicinamibacterales bacterium]HJO39040.1 methyltransferase domain-containing protein [Vicinamibacterales bacterium]|tara:strand:- start:2162 stop:2989 length:828 start_codon:yes stop_codon:yes gene_type:complete
MAEIDYTAVRRYWSNARPSILGPYMMDGFGFPPAAGLFRFKAEQRIVQGLVQGLDRAGTVLDLGSGIGFWAAAFARQFAQVVAVEASPALCDALRERCAPHANVRVVQQDVLSFEPDGSYELVFLGGMLMYLNDREVIALLRKIVPRLTPGGMILCRETTVRKGVVTRSGEYQATYRSIGVYRRLFAECRLSASQIEPNAPYVLLQLGCELMKKWQAVTPPQLRELDGLLGRLVYWGLRLGNPWILRIPDALWYESPQWLNHFFVLGPDVAHDRA